jgi:Cysteine rich repeat
MMVRRLTLASLFSLAAVSLAGSALAQTEAMALCKSDIARLCPGVQPGGGRIIGCLKAHKMEMSVGCAKALQKMKANMGQ